LEFITNPSADTNNTQAGPDALNIGTTGEIGNGPFMDMQYLSFNASGANMGCDSTGPDCDFIFAGLRYDATIKGSRIVTSIAITVPACPSLKDCQLVPVTLDNSFENLNAIRINVTVAGEPKIWWLDDLALGWYNNTCAAGLQRQAFA
jgi:hypothetical protein